MVREEVISSGTVEAAALARSSSSPSPAANSAAASSHAAPINTGSTDWLGSAHGSKAGSLSSAVAQVPLTSLSNNVGTSTLGSPDILCRPWERGDLLRRLATFEPSNWPAKPKGASSLTCARRGWTNVGIGKIECELCGFCLTFAKSVLRAIDGGMFAEKLDSGHKTACPWKENCCADGLVQFPPAPASALIGSYKDRCDGLLQFPHLPLIASSTIEFMKLSRSAQIERIILPSLFSSGEMGFNADNIVLLEISDPFVYYSQAQKLISLCGWEPRWLPNVQDCEEYSAQSARNACSYKQFSDLSKHTLSASAKKNHGKGKAVEESRRNLKSPVLDCSLCGATIRVWDFLTVSQLARPGPSNIDNTKNCKKLLSTHGTSAASGINGGIAPVGMQKEPIDVRDEAATTDAKSPSNAILNLNLEIADRNTLDACLVGGELIIGHPSGSEVGDRAASFESRGPSSRKRSLEEGGSTVDRPQDKIQMADSIEGTVVNRDDDEVDGGAQESDGLSKRARGPNISLKLDQFGAGPSHCYFGTINRMNSYREGSEPITRNSAHASSVVAMDTICHSDDEDSMESVENRPGDFDRTIFCRSNSALEIDSTIDDAKPATAYGIDAFLPRTYSAFGEVGLIAEGAENMGQCGESGSGPGLMDEFASGEVLREGDHQSDVQDMMSRSVAKDDSGSKVWGSIKAESIESGEKMNGGFGNESSAHPSLSCNAMICSLKEMSREVMQTGKETVTCDCALVSDNAIAISSGHLNEERNINGKRGPGEFDPIKHHNVYCPWVNGNVAGAGLNADIADDSIRAVALSGWQLTLDALDAFQSIGHIPNQMMQSESAASLYKDDHFTPGQKYLSQSASKSSRKRFD